MEADRRQFFTQLGRTVAHAIGGAVERMRIELDSSTDDAAQRPPQGWIRPPGALPGAAFRAVCTRCTACQEVCPYQSIRRLGPECGADSGTPAIIPLESPCYLCADLPCIAACEPGALRPMDRNHASMGRAALRRDDCYISAGQPCGYCVKRCPLTADAIGTGDDGVPVIHADGCVGCGVCAYLCPAGAIDIVPM